MTPEMTDVMAVVLEQIGEQMDLLDSEGAAYARECLLVASRPKTRSAPRRPVAMHPKLAEMVRSMVSDELAVSRYYGLRRAVSL